MVPSVSTSGGNTPVLVSSGGGWKRILGLVAVSLARILAVGFYLRQTVVFIGFYIDSVDLYHRANVDGIKDRMIECHERNEWIQLIDCASDNALENAATAFGWAGLAASAIPWVLFAKTRSELWSGALGVSSSLVALIVIRSVDNLKWQLVCILATLAASTALAIIPPFVRLVKISAVERDERASVTLSSIQIRRKEDERQLELRVRAKRFVESIPTWAYVATIVTGGVVLAWFFTR
jgi:hypothetical protein